MHANRGELRRKGDPVIRQLTTHQANASCGIPGMCPVVADRMADPRVFQVCIDLDGGRSAPKERDMELLFRQYRVAKYPATDRNSPVGMILERGDWFPRKPHHVKVSCEVVHFSFDCPHVFFRGHDTFGEPTNRVCEPMDRGAKLSPKPGDHIDIPLCNAPQRTHVATTSACSLLAVTGRESDQVCYIGLLRGEGRFWQCLLFNKTVIDPHPRLKTLGLVVVICQRMLIVARKVVVAIRLRYRNIEIEHRGIIL